MRRSGLLLSLCAVVSCTAADEPSTTSLTKAVQNPEEDQAIRCALAVSADRPGLSGTTPKLAFDGSSGTSFRSSHDNWQYLQIDYGCAGDFTGLRRHMTRDGKSTTGTRGAQGEAVSVSLDGVSWTALSGATSSGWSGYVNYSPAAWHSLPYGWSAWIKPTAPLRARYVRFRWDGALDALNEVQVQLRVNAQPTPAALELAQREALVRLTEASRFRPKLTLARGLPVAMSLDAPATGNDAVARARGFLATYRGLFGLADPDQQLVPARIRSRALTHVQLAQRHGGVQVYGAALSVHLAGSRVVATTGAWLPFVPALPPARVSAREAEAAAIAHVKTPAVAVAGDTRAVYFNRELLGGAPDATHLAWRVVLRAPRPGPGWIVLVDAHDGAALRKSPLDRTGTPHKDYYVEDDVSGDEWFNENGQTSDYNLAADPGAEGFLADSFLNQTYDFYHTHFDRHAWDDQDGELEVNVHLDEQNAWWDGDELNFGNGFVERDIFAHEYTHAVIDYTSELEYETESGALNESYADLMGCLVDGDWFFPGIRNLEDPPMFGDPDHMRDFESLPHGEDPDSDNDYGFVHTNSGINNKAGYLLAHGGTHEGVTVVGLGTPKAAKLFYETMNALSSNASFAAAATLSIANARAFASAGTAGFTMTDACQVIRAYQAVGLSGGDLDCDGQPDRDDTDDDGDGVADGSDLCPVTFDPSQLDTDGDRLGDACDPNIDNDARDNGQDNCPLIPNDQTDSDHDGLGNPCDLDDDNDRDLDGADNCPRIYNPDQLDSDLDGTGDACDGDRDGDLVSNGSDVCPDDHDPGQEDDDADRAGDLCDNCRGVPNPTQLDIDDDELGDECDGDMDGDGIDNGPDNCDRAPNPQQEDHDKNGVGFACDFAEQRMLTGKTTVEWMRWLAHMDDRPLIRVPIDPVGPCDVDCPDWLGESFTMRVQLRLPADLPVRVVDDRGKALATGKPGANQVLTFRPGSDWRNHEYYLEITRTAAVKPGQDIPVESAITKHPGGL